MAGEFFIEFEQFVMKQRKVALVTGCANGIGRASALSLARSGMDLVLVDIEQEGLDVLRKNVIDLGSRSAVICGDCQDEHILDEVFEFAQRDFGAIDVLVNNLGRSAREHASSFLDSSPDTWSAVLDISLMTTLRVTHRAAPSMKRRGWGRIINMSSDTALIGDEDLADYAAAKSGLLGFTRVLARELGSYGITVNAICPGAIKTRAHDHLKPSILEKIKSTIPMNRVGEPEEVAGLVSFLSGDGASYITGQAIAINGGRYML